jgi:hypothetical protein
LARGSGWGLAPARGCITFTYDQWTYSARGNTYFKWGPTHGCNAYHMTTCHKEFGRTFKTVKLRPCAFSYDHVYLRARELDWPWKWLALLYLHEVPWTHVPTSLAVRGWRTHNRPTVRTICAVAFGARFLCLNKRVC